MAADNKGQRFRHNGEIKIYTISHPLLIDHLDPTFPVELLIHMLSRYDLDHDLLYDLNPAFIVEIYIVKIPSVQIHTINTQSRSRSTIDDLDPTFPVETYPTCQDTIYCGSRSFE